MVIRAPPQSVTSESLPWSNALTYTQPADSPYLVNFTSVTDPKTKEKSTLIAIDFRETAPALSDPQMYVKAPSGSSQVGGLSIGVPGELRGLYTAFEMYGSGRVEWSDLVQPVVDLAKGWRVSRELARRFRIYGSEYGPGNLLFTRTKLSIFQNQASWKAKTNGRLFSDLDQRCSSKATTCPVTITLARSLLLPSTVLRSSTVELMARTMNRTRMLGLPRI
jgi:hypothetical protein